MNALRKLGTEDGVVTIIVAAMLTALVLSVAVVIDLGLLYQERRQLQTSTDAAALAAAMDLAEGMSAGEAEAKATKYVSDNANVTPSQVSIDYPAAQQVRVIATTQRSVFFAGLVEKSTAQVSTRSTAALGAANGVAKCVPFIVPVQKVQEYSGPGNAGTFELGEDRPADPFSIMQTINDTTINYTITYNNTSNKTESATIRDPIPNDTVYVGDSATSGGSYSPSDKEVTWSFSGVAPGDYRVVRFSVRATSASPSSITNTAYLTTSSTGKVMSATTGGGAQKGYFWLCDFDNGRNATPDFDSWIRQGYPEYVYAGDIANGCGMKASLKDALTWRLGFDSSIIVPVYSFTDGGGSVGEYHVVGFAEFVVTRFDLNGSPKTITGYFTDGTVVNGVPGAAPPAYFGVDTIWLAH